MNRKETNQDLRRVRAQFAPETRFGVRVRPTRVALDAELEELKNRLLREYLRLAEDPALPPALVRAAQEAAALVGLTPYPLLLLPALFEEKAAEAKRYVEHQSLVRRRSRRLLDQAA